MALKDEKGELKTERGEFLKIMENNNETISHKSKRETEEKITKEECGRGHQQRPPTDKGMKIEVERERATLTKYLKGEDQPIKQYITALITDEEEVKKK